MTALHIAGRELRSLFLSPMAWVALAVIHAILAYVFLIQIDAFLEWQPRLAGVEGAPGLTAIVVAPLARTTGIVLLLVSPLLTMRLIAEERRAGTLTLILSAPVSMTSIVIGKFLGVMVFFALALAMVSLMPLSLLAGGTLDVGLAASSLIGIVLLSMCLCAVGLFMSTLSRQPVVAALATFGLLLALWIIDWAGNGPDEASRLFAYLSIMRHLDAPLRGALDSRDVSYYVLFTTLFLGLSIRRLDSLRLTG